MNRWREVGSNSLRYCERSDEPGVPFSVIAARSGTDEAIHSFRDIHGLLRFARNDGIQQPIKAIREKAPCPRTLRNKSIPPHRCTPKRWGRPRATGG